LTNLGREEERGKERKRGGEREREREERGERGRGQPLTPPTYSGGDSGSSGLGPRILVLADPLKPSIFSFGL